MKIEITQLKEDLIAFYQFDRWYSDEKKSYRIKSRITWGLITAIPLWITIINLGDIQVKSTIGLIFYGLFFFSLGFFGVKPAVLSHMRGVVNKITSNKLNNDLLGKKIMEFRENEIIWTSESSHGQSDIKTIKKIKEDGNYYYLYDTSFSAYVVPKKIFQTREKAKEFESIVKNYLHS